MIFMTWQNRMDLNHLFKDFDPQKGIALLMVLWVLTILMVIVLSFSFMVKTDTLSTLSFKGGMERKSIAEAGIERGVMELHYRNTYKDQTVELEGKEIWKTDGTPYTGKLGNGHYTVRLTDESGKVDINTASELVLKNLFLNMGVQAEEADTIVDSIMDWKDVDNLHRLHGAESDYYMSLPNPYKAKDAPFDTVEELLLVKGVTSEILYGSKDRKGVINFLTVNSKMDRININAATKEVLMAIPNMTPEIAEAIITYRQNKEITDMQEIQGIIGGGDSDMSRYISTSGTNMFTIDSSGSKENEKGMYTIRATVMVSTGTDQPHTFVYYKSPIGQQQ
jgi:general secretion pathway protein K